MLAFFQKINRNLIEDILSYLDLTDLISVRLVSKLCYQTSTSVLAKQCCQAAESLKIKSWDDRREWIMLLELAYKFSRETHTQAKIVSAVYNFYQSSAYSSAVTFHNLLSPVESKGFLERYGKLRVIAKKKAAHAAIEILVKNHDIWHQRYIDLALSITHSLE